MGGRPLATRYIRDDDFLPIELHDLDEGAGNPVDSMFRNHVSAIALPDVGTFGRHAQAAYLLDRVLPAVNVDVIDHSKWAAELISSAHDTLERLLSTVMGQAGGRWGVYCGATAMMVT
jgi:hypothetical protein